MSDSQFVRHEPCPKCGSSNNLARYSDGHAYCFGCEHREPPDGEEMNNNHAPREDREERPVGGIVPGSFIALNKRGITADTCRFWSYQAGEMNGQKVQLANHIGSDGSVVAQKIRFPDKQFRVTGNRDELHLYGMWLWKGFSRNKLVITEGEIDALSVYQVSAQQFAVVSLPNGAQAAKKAILKDIEFVNSFKEVVLAFDMDEPGRKAAQEVAKILPPGKARIAEFTEKDANDMLKAGLSGELFRSLINARPYKPSGLVGVADVKHKVLEEKSVGLPWWDDRLTQLTYGRRKGEIYMLGAGTGVGKTDYLSQQIEYDLNVLKEKVAVFFLEQEPSETVTRIAGKAAKKLFHIPGSGWSKEELVSEVDKLETSGLQLYDHFGECDWDNIESSIRYLHHAEGYAIFYIDHLTALAAAEEDERVGLEKIMAKMGRLVKEIPILIICVSHLATPEGKPHEEGGRVMIRHFKGSRTIGFWSHFMFGLERNQQSDDPAERSRTTFRILKDRFTGRGTGQTLSISYEQATGRLLPSDSQEATPSGFSDEPTDF